MFNANVIGPGDRYHFNIDRLYGLFSLGTIIMSFTEVAKFKINQVHQKRSKYQGNRSCKITIYEIFYSSKHSNRCLIGCFLTVDERELMNQPIVLHLRGFCNASEIYSSMKSRSGGPVNTISIMSHDLRGKVFLVKRFQLTPSS